MTGKINLFIGTNCGGGKNVNSHTSKCRIKEKYLIKAQNVVTMHSLCKKKLAGSGLEEKGARATPLLSRI